MNLIKQGFIYYLLATIFGGLLLMFYIQGDSVVASMDAAGWLFFVTSCLSHAAILLLALWLVFFLPWALLRKNKLATGLFISAVSILAILAFINMQVYKIYRFHINGFIIKQLNNFRSRIGLFFQNKIITYCFCFLYLF